MAGMGGENCHKILDSARATVSKVATEATLFQRKVEVPKSCGKSYRICACESILHTLNFLHDVKAGAKPESLV